MPSEPSWMLFIPCVIAAFSFGAIWGAHREHREWLALYERSNEVILRMLRQLLRERDCEEDDDAKT